LTRQQLTVDTKWQVIRGYNLYHSITDDKTAKTAVDESKSKEGTSGMVGKGPKDSYDIHASRTKKHTNDNCWQQQHRGLAPERYAEKGERDNENNKKKPKKDGPSRAALDTSTVLLHLGTACSTKRT